MGHSIIAVYSFLSLSGDSSIEAVNDEDRDRSIGVKTGLSHALVKLAP